MIQQVHGAARESRPDRPRGEYARSAQAQHAPRSPGMVRCSEGRDEDRQGLRGEAEAAPERSAAFREGLAVPVALGLVAEADVPRRRQALHVVRGEARRAARVDGARAAADGPDALVAVGHGRGLLLAPRERVGGLADEGELGVGGGEPVRHLGLADDRARALGRSSVSSRRRPDA